MTPATTPGAGSTAGGAGAGLRRSTPDTAAAQLRRILDLVPRVADGESHAISALARDAEVDERTLLRDLQSLSSRLDAPGGFVEGLTILVEPETVEVHTNHFLRPMGLTVPELRALELGLAVLATERPPEAQRAIAGARTRLRNVLAALPGEPAGATQDVVTAGAAAPLDQVGRATLDVLRQARIAGRRVRIAYRKPDATRSYARTVCPYALVVSAGAWYLVGLCEASEGLRIFRLDRVEHAEATEAAYTVPEDFDVAAVLATGRPFLTEAVPEVLVVRYGSRVARWVAEREGRTLDADGSLTLEHPLADEGWAVRHLLQYGPDAEVLAPESVRHALVARLEAMLAEGAEPGA